ncbi:MAG: PKD domain-containing protein, partial [Flavobacteriales bacterium]|nr:PKD domain-containing protein [Flavobacteriales bacterium]
MKKLLPLLFISATFISSPVFAGGGAPANDGCVTAEPIFCGQTLTGTTVGASTDGTLPICGIDGLGNPSDFTTAPGVWYTFVGDGSATTISTCNQADYDTKIGIFNGTCGALSCVESNDDAVGCIGFTSELTFASVCGETYYIYVTGFGTDAGNFDLSLSCVGGVTFPIAPQDITIQLDGTGNYSFTTPLTPQTDAEVTTSAGSSFGSFIWQSFTPTVDGILSNIAVTYASIPAIPTVDVVIRDGQGTGGTVLFVQTITVTTAGTPTVINLSGTVDLIAGNQYTFELQGGSAQEIQRNGGDPYAGGISSFGAGTDIRFSVDVLQRPDIDNGSVASMGIAFFGLSQSSFDCNDVGTVPVTLTVTENGGATSSCVAMVTVEDNDNPVAACIAGTPQFALDGSGSYTIDPLADIDNGTTDNCNFTLSTSPASFTCADIGVQSIMLTAEDPSGNTNSCTTDIEIVDNTVPNAVCQNITVYLDGSGAVSVVPGDVNGGSSDNCGIATMSLSKLDFNCGDLGDNAVTLTVEDNNSLTATCTATVEVLDTITPTITCVADIVVCSDNASGVTVAYAATAGSDNCGFTITQTDVSGLTSGNVFPIGVTAQEWTIEDVAGNTATCSFTVTVNATPVADYEYSPACQGEAITFTDLSTIEAGYSIASWSWDMDDGSAPIGLVDPIHLFADTGMYNVELVVISAAGCPDTSTQAVHVTPVPVASFTFVEECEGDAVTFTNTSTIDAGNLNYEWDFGDGSPTSSMESPDHTFADFGTYTVTLTVTSDDGCEDITTASINIFESPTALFTATTECDGMSTEFTNLSTGSGVLDYEWDFDDATPTSTDFEPVHPYAGFGDYEVVLTVTDNNSCSNSANVTVTVLELPVTDFNFTDACEGTDVPFQNTSDAGSYVWDFDDATPTTAVTNPIHVFESSGTYDVKLTVTDGNFCINS